LFNNFLGDNEVLFVSLAQCALKYLSIPATSAESKGILFFVDCKDFVFILNKFNFMLSSENQ